MRIFQVLESSTNLSVPANKSWLRNLYEPLLEAGHDVVLCPAEQGRVAMMQQNPKLRSRFSAKLLDYFTREHKKNPIDLFFSYLMDGMIDGGAIDEIRQTGVTCCNFSCNNAHQFSLVEELSSHFDYNLHSEKDTAEKFRSIGARSLWWPMASNPRYFKPQRVGRSIDVSFVGGNYGIRAGRIHSLLRNGVDVHAYGPGWRGGASTPIRSFAKRVLYILQLALSSSPEDQVRASAKLADHDMRRLLWKKYADHVHSAVSDEELVSLYSKSKISLGCLEVYDNHDPSLGVVHHLHLREFEAPMCRALYCTTHSEELAEMFEPDKEVLTYRDECELLSKVKFFLRHSSEAEKVREAGYRRALADHTYQRRFEQLFAAIGLQ